MTFIAPLVRIASFSWFPRLLLYSVSLAGRSEAVFFSLPLGFLRSLLGPLIYLFYRPRMPALQEKSFHIFLPLVSLKISIQQFFYGSNETKSLFYSFFFKAKRRWRRKNASFLFNWKPIIWYWEKQFSWKLKIDETNITLSNNWGF